MDNYKPNPIINKVAQADTFKKINPSNISTESPIIIRVFVFIKYILLNYRIYFK